MIAKALIFAVFCVQAIRFDDKAELASLSALISKLKPKTKNTVGLGNTTGTVLSEVDESAGNGGTIKDLLNEIKNSIIDNKKDAIKQEADHCTDSVDGSVGETELDFGDSTKYFDLVGCDETSTCETGTDKEQTIATDAHARIQALEAALADLENKLKIKQAASATKTGDIEALEKKKTDNDALHQIRMKKFGDAITILNKIDSGLDESGKITMPEFLQLSKEEKKAIQNFRVGAAMLLVLDQATSGVGEKDLVQQLKTLLASCISSLETSKANEVKKHDDWIGFIEAELGGAQKEGEDIVTEIANLQGQILANKQETAAEEKKKADAIKISNSLRQTCLDAHSTYISDLAAYDSEIAAIEEMIKILIEAKLDDQTTAIRDETDLTKHGVEESLGGGDCTENYELYKKDIWCGNPGIERDIPSRKKAENYRNSRTKCQDWCNAEPTCKFYLFDQNSDCSLLANCDGEVNYVSTDTSIVYKRGCGDSDEPDDNEDGTTITDVEYRLGDWTDSNSTGDGCSKMGCKRVVSNDCGEVDKKPYSIFANLQDQLNKYLIAARSDAARRFVDLMSDTNLYPGGDASLFYTTTFYRYSNCENEYPSGDGCFAKLTPHNWYENKPGKTQKPMLMGLYRGEESKGAERKPPCKLGTHLCDGTAGQCTKLPDTLNMLPICKCGSGEI